MGTAGHDPAGYDFELAAPERPGTGDEALNLASTRDFQLLLTDAPAAFGPAAPSPPAS